MRKYKYAFIGGGPATLAALNGLSPADRASCIVLEAGDAARKICPGIKERTCTSCSEELCPVINGLGGSSFGFGNKLCEFPASQHVIQGLTPDRLAGVDYTVSEIFSASVLTEPVKAFTAHPGYLNRKHYSAQIALADDYRNSISAVSNRVFAECDLQTGFVVSEIEFVADEFWISSEAGEQIRADNFVMATGRSGHTLVRQVLPKLGVRIVENLADVGFRVVSKSKNFADAFFYQTDPKYKFEFADLGSARTFCACKGGVIVPVKFGKGFYADGAFVRTLKKSTNIAIMARSKQIVEYDRLEEWCVEINERNGSGLTLGSFDCGGSSDRAVAAQIKDLMPIGLSVHHDAILEKMVDQLIVESDVKLLKPPSMRGGEIDIVGPSIDRFWPLVDMQSSMIKAGRVSVLGDAAGASRGIYQAIASGVIWANERTDSSERGFNCYAYATSRP